MTKKQYATCLRRISVLQIKQTKERLTRQETAELLKLASAQITYERKYAARAMMVIASLTFTSSKNPHNIKTLH
jgi:hypothetical protein